LDVGARERTTWFFDNDYRVGLRTVCGSAKREITRANDEDGTQCVFAKVEMGDLTAEVDDRALVELLESSRQAGEGIRVEDVVLDGSLREERNIGRDRDEVVGECRWLRL
jgi:hypothetical protein